MMVEPIPPSASTPEICRAFRGRWSLGVAEMHAQPHSLALPVGCVAKQDLLAYVTAYGEEEVIALPESVAERE